MVEVHAKGSGAVRPASFDRIPRLHNAVPVLVFFFQLVVWQVGIASSGNRQTTPSSRG
jgi:hypothetical protein